MARRQTATTAEEPVRAAERPAPPTPARLGRRSWFWISNIAVLLGAELNAELERGRKLEAGQPAHDQILVPPRAEPKPER